MWARRSSFSRRPSKGALTALSWVVAAEAPRADFATRAKGVEWCCHRLLLDSIALSPALEKLLTDEANAALSLLRRTIPCRGRSRRSRLTMIVTSSLYDRLGGEAAVGAAVPRFYEKIMGDPALASFFVGLEMDAQIAKQIAFMTMAFGGPNAYTGRDLRTAHGKLVKQGLGDAHFDSVAAHLSATLGELGVEPPMIEEVLAIVGSTRQDVLCR